MQANTQRYNRCNLQLLLYFNCAIQGFGTTVKKTYTTITIEVLHLAIMCHNSRLRNAVIPFNGGDALLFILLHNCRIPDDVCEKNSGQVALLILRV